MKKKSKETNKATKRLVLLDAHAIIHRAYHALPDFTSHKGEPTGALYGLSSMLLKLVKDLSPDYIIACYDLPEPTYRHEVYKEYKAGRAKIDDELAEQLNRSRDIFSVFGIQIYEKAGFEADDMLGTIVEQVQNNKNISTVIASGDMDTLQLVVDEKVQVYTLKKGINDTVLYNEKAVEERFGFKPELLTDYKGLRGDPSDNIIGIAGIGEKTATTLIQKFGTIEEIYAKLKKDAAQFEKKGIKPRIISLLIENEEEARFSKMLATIRRDAPIVFSLPNKEWRNALLVDNVLELFSELGFRTLSVRVREMFGVEEEAEKVGMSKKEEPAEEEIQKLALALWVLRSNYTNPTLEDIYEYTQTNIFSKAHKIIFDEIKKQKLLRVYEDIELPLTPVINKMEARGITTDCVYLKKLSKQYHSELDKIEKRIYKYADEKFNINSPKQLGEILFDKLQLTAKNLKRTGTGQKSTRESELEKLREVHPIIKEIFSYRELQKLLSTYIDNIPDMVDSDGRLHAKFLQTGTTTGRMSSQNPNLQNIPIKTELGRNVRNAFVATKGFTLVSLDYSQIELRVAAFLSEDKKLIDVFKDGGDIHTTVASEVFGVAPDKVDSEMRRQAKVINFGIQYGMGVGSLQKNLGTTRKEAQRFYNEYFEKFSGLAIFITNTKASAAKNGYTETFFGRKRYFEGINSHIPFVRAAAERMAINAPIQGTQADIVKIAMARIDEYLVSQKLEKDAHLLLQVHDELIYEIKTTKMKQVTVQIKKIMEEVLSLRETSGVPIVADMMAGDNWGEMK